MIDLVFQEMEMLKEKNNNQKQYKVQVKKRKIDNKIL